MDPVQSDLTRRALLSAGAVTVAAVAGPLAATAATAADAAGTTGPGGGPGRHGPSRQLGRFVRDVAENPHTGMRVRVVWRRDRYLRGSDHISFLQQGYPAARFTEPREKDNVQFGIRAVDRAGHRSPAATPQPGA
jgi:hypothetical protein